MSQGCAKYEAFRCTLLDEEGQKYIDCTRRYIDEVKEKLKNKEIPDEESDKAFREALGILTPTFPGTEAELRNAPQIVTPWPDLEKKITELQKEQADFKTQVGNMQKQQEDMKTEVKNKQKQQEDLKAEFQNMKKQQEDLKSEIENMKKQRVKELSKYSAKVKKLIKGNEQNALALRSANKSLSCFREIIKRTKEPNTRAKELNTHPSIDIPGPSEEPLKIDLHLLSNCRLKEPVKALASITDCVAFSEDSFLLAEQTDKESRIGLYNLQGKEIQSWPLEKKVMTKLAVLHGGESFIASKCNKIDRYIINSQEISQIYQSDKYDIHTIAALTSSTFAAAVYTRILLMDTGGTVFKSISVESPAIDMCAPTDDKLVIHQRGGLCEADIHDGGTVVKEVPQIKSVSSLAGFKRGYFFVCDSKEKAVYLLGPDAQTVHRSWNCSQWFKTTDELLRVSVLGNKCVCVSKFCHMLVFEINEAA